MAATELSTIAILRITLEKDGVPGGTMCTGFAELIGLTHLNFNSDVIIFVLIWTTLDIKACIPMLVIK